LWRHFAADFVARIKMPNDLFRSHPAGSPPSDDPAPANIRQMSKLAGSSSFNHREGKEHTFDQSHLMASEEASVAFAATRHKPFGASRSTVASAGECEFKMSGAVL
jgi:hypothetical protein